MKNVIAILLMMVMIVMLVVGCVSRNDYNGLMAEYDTVCVRVTSLQGELTASQGQIQTLQSDFAAEQNKAEELESDLTAERSNSQNLENDLTAAQAQMETLEDDINKVENDLATAQRQLSELRGVETELRSLWDSLQEKMALREAITDFWCVASLAAAGEITESEATIRATVFLGKTDDIENIEDAELSQLWEDFFTYAEKEKEAECLSSLAAFTERISDLIDQDIEAIEAQLSSAPAPAPAPAPPPAPPPAPAP